MLELAAPTSVLFGATHLNHVLSLFRRRVQLLDDRALEIAAQGFRGGETLPFGGVGPSGMGVYHGLDGFRQFSHAKAIYRQARVDLTSLFGMRAPYGDKFKAAVERFMRT